ncbi:hypothetical protein [Aquimarina sp. I32.4]|uniref:hypothetical protein n=1 Tax=Aquimarina sp. I32.4 TaxID=2053903 RepID=UPI000CDE6813|nr:hypothetical protein [Aquimarina sp. I32.4]
MNIETAKLELMHLLLQTQKESLIKRLQKVFEEEADLWNDFSKEEQKAIEEGLQQADQGKYTSDQQAMKRFSKWH